MSLSLFHFFVIDVKPGQLDDVVRLDDDVGHDVVEPNVPDKEELVAGL